MQLGQKIQQNKHSKVMGNKFNFSINTLGNKQNTIVNHSKNHGMLSPNNMINNNTVRKSILEK